MLCAAEGGQSYGGVKTPAFPTITVRTRGVAVTYRPDLSANSSRPWARSRSTRGRAGEGKFQTSGRSWRARTGKTTTRGRSLSGARAGSRNISRLWSVRGCCSENPQIAQILDEVRSHLRQKGSCLGDFGARAVSVVGQGHELRIIASCFVAVAGKLGRARGAV